jgi:hypothetical protein
MKNLLMACVLLTASLSGIAGEITLKEILGPEARNKEATSKFRIDPELGRAWVEVRIIDIFDDNYDRKHQIEVEGLSFDVNNSAIVYEQGGIRTECAILIPGRTLIRRMKIRLTGNCEFSERSTKLVSEDGTRAVPRFRAILQIEN